MDDDDAVDRKLWMGDLEPYMDEAFLRAAFQHFGFTVNAFKWIKSHHTGYAKRRGPEPSMLARYCFVEFPERILAGRALEQLAGLAIPGSGGLKKFKLNWASRKVDAGQQDYNAFVAELSRDVTSRMLLECFQRSYKSVRYAKVIEDDDGVSKGYGFVRFTDEGERDASIARFDGTTGLGKKPIAVKLALAPRQREPQSTMPPPSSAHPPPVPFPASSPVPYPDYTAWPAYSTAQPPATVPTVPPTAPFVVVHTLPIPVPLPYAQDALQDPNPPLDVTAENHRLFQHDQDLFQQLLASRRLSAADVPVP